MNNKDKTFPLLYAEQYEKLCVTEIRGGQQFKDKCINQGIVPGQKIEILNNSGNGPCLIKLLNSRIIIGRGMLNRILVKQK